MLILRDCWIASCVAAWHGRRTALIEFELLRDAGVLIVAPKETLTAEDFRAISSTVDPYISENGKLTGLLLEAPSFPGWDSLSTAIDHMRFVRDHHRKIEQDRARRRGPTGHRHAVADRRTLSPFVRGKRPCPEAPPRPLA